MRVQAACCWRICAASIRNHRVHAAGSVTDPVNKEQTRKQTASEVLQLIAGQQLPDASRERQLLGALHLLPAPRVPARWLSLAENVQTHGSVAVRQQLGKSTFRVPDVEGASECRCSLAAKPTAKRFVYPQLNRFLANLFSSIPPAVTSSGLPKVNLDRFDLFHAHLFCTQSYSLGMLFHAKEYPAFDKEHFPINLGYCQQSSTLKYNEQAMNMRNLVWFQGRMCLLDVGPSSILHHNLIMDGLQDVRTVLESDFGEGVIDINYFASLPVAPQHRLFCC